MQRSNLIAMASTLALAAGGLIAWQFDDFLALDAASRASWVQAIGTIGAIIASSIVAILIDQGTSRRIEAVRTERVAKTRAAAVSALRRAAETVAEVPTAFAGAVKPPAETNQALWPLHVRTEVISNLLRSDIPPDLIEPLVTGRDVVQYVSRMLSDPSSNGMVDVSGPTTRYRLDILGVETRVERLSELAASIEAYPAP